MSKLKKPIIEPIIRFVNEPKEHVLEKLMSGETPPTLISVGSINVPGTNTYVSYVLHSKGNEVLKIEVGEPNLKLISDDEAKINFVNHVLAPTDF